MNEIYQNESSFKQLAQKMSDGRHPVVGLFVEGEQPGGNWFERNGMVMVALMMPGLLCSYFYFSQRNRMDSGVDDKENTSNEKETEEDGVKNE